MVCKYFHSPSSGHSQGWKAQRGGMGWGEVGGGATRSFRQLLIPLSPNPLHYPCTSDIRGEQGMKQSPTPSTVTYGLRETYFETKQARIILLSGRPESRKIYKKIQKPTGRKYLKPSSSLFISCFLNFYICMCFIMHLIFWSRAVTHVCV